VAVVGLRPDHGVDAAADRGRDPGAAIVDDLNADRAGRQEAGHDRANVIQPGLDGPVITAAMEGLASIIADGLGDQNGGHGRIVAPQARQRRFAFAWA
jgi:hypothetical protein